MNNSIALLIFNMIYGCIMLLLGIFLKKNKALKYSDYVYFRRLF